MKFSDTIPQYLYNYSYNQDIWVGNVYNNKRARYITHSDTITNYILTGQISDDFDISKADKVDIEPVRTGYSIIINKEIFFFSSTKLYKLQDDRFILDSTFIKAVENTNVAKKLVYTNGLCLDELKAIDLGNNRKGIRASDRIFFYANGTWGKNIKVDSLNKNLESFCSINEKGFYFTANRKLYYHNFKKTIRILENYENIMTVSKGPNGTLIFRQGFNKDYNLGGLFLEESKKTYPIRASKINNNYYTQFRFMTYRETTNTILVLSSQGLYEFDICELFFN